ncbi:MAG TPA: N-acetylmuramoyl-L-alanine amidase, partial [Balneola sp.]|nr:N-acetylmuramoyl-L-alanine amidase [Balneola sp.]
VQMVLYGDIDTTGIQMPGYGEKVNQVILYKQDYGFGVDIYLSQDFSYIADAYPDQNQTHLLVGLTETDYNELDAYSQQFIAKNWYENFEPQELPDPVSITETGSTTTITDSYNPVRDKLKFDKIVIDA